MIWTVKLDFIQVQIALHADEPLTTEINWRISIRFGIADLR